MITILVWSERLLALAIFFQTIEMMQLRPLWSDLGIWRWSTLQKDFSSMPAGIPKLFDFLFKEKSFQSLLWIRLIAAFSVWIIPPGTIIMAILFFTTWLIPIRWRGLFNGGSDSMTALVAFALWIAQSFSSHEGIVKACFAYIAVQVTASYFIAGIVKAKNHEWREGFALPIFFKTPRYDSPPEWAKRFFDHPVRAQWASNLIIIFECTFPIAWLNPQLCIAYLVAAFLFHVLNFWIFGLNRFVFAWLAGYPALYYMSTLLTRP